MRLQLTDKDDYWCKPLTLALNEAYVDGGPDPAGRHIQLQFNSDEQNMLKHAMECWS